MTADIVIRKAVPEEADRLGDIAYEAWERGEGWERVRVEAKDCPRISAEFLKEEMSALGPMQFSQEYECQFIDNETSVFNSELIEAALTDDFAPFLARAAWVWGGRSMIYSRPRACRPMAFRLRLEPRSQKTRCITACQN